ncbi:MAG: DUF305 domain-containing protein [Herminiimonas sp.]|nr:DUF305 domain-containing protein [Herminiimonas sp.]
MNHKFGGTADLARAAGEPVNVRRIVIGVLRGFETFHQQGDHMNKYARFAAMIGVSTAAMLGLMYLNTYQLDHVFFSQTRAWMALVMGTVMAVVMLLFMLDMYTRKSLNLVILAGSAVVFAIALWLVRSQQTVDDVAYMKAMIPHHSIAILTSKRAQIVDPRVRRLADGIIEAQEREIGEMKNLIKQLEQNPGKQ